MHVLRTFRMSAAVLAATLTIGALGTGAAEAGKPLPRPTGLAAAVTAHPGDTYDVAATWNVSANATSYRVALTKGGATLVSTTVTTNSWSSTVTATPGNATLSVRAVAGHKPGKPATISVALPDVTAPTGTYTSTWSNDTGVATITQGALADDSGTAGITRVVDWGDSSPTVAWTSGNTLDHTYAHDHAGRYVPTVTLADAAHNQAVVDVPAVVIQDDTAPTAGTYAVSNLNPWATLTSVTVSETAAPSDNWSPADNILRTVDWGDGTTSTWTGAGSGHHVYAAAGTYSVVVTDTDEAHHATTAASATIVAKADTVAPKVSIAAAKPAHSVKAWRTLHGTATDAGTGVKSVSVKAVEKRGKTWFGYNAATATWVKAATKTKAFAKSRAIVRTTNAQHRWTAKLVGLRKGSLIVKVWATDAVKNRSVVLIRKASLTAR